MSESDFIEIREGNRLCYPLITLQNISTGEKKSVAKFQLSLEFTEYHKMPEELQSKNNLLDAFKFYEEFSEMGKITREQYAELQLSVDKLVSVYFSTTKNDYSPETHEDSKNFIKNFACQMALLSHVLVEHEKNESKNKKTK